VPLNIHERLQRWSDRGQIAFPLVDLAQE